MEVKDWAPLEKDSFTTPGGTFRLPDEGGARTYQFDRASNPGRAEPVRPAPRTEAPSSRETSPFAPGAGTAQPWYAGVAAQNYAAPAAAAQPQAAPTVLLSPSGETQTAIPVQTVPGGPQVYTIQIPTPRQPAPKQRSLWWVPLVVIAALLTGILLGLLLAPVLGGVTEPATTQAPSKDDGTAAGRIYRENVDTVVSVTAASPTSAPGSSSVGTGFLITGDGYLLTNAHVVLNRENIIVTLNDGRELSAQVVAVENAVSDIALLKIEAAGLHPVTLGNSATAQVGDAVFTIGNPMGDLSNSLSAGYLSAGPRQIDTGTTTLNMLQTNAAINKGNSGGPLFDAEGKVIGVVTAKRSGSDADSTVEGLGFALPINDVMEIVTPWLSAARGG